MICGELIKACGLYSEAHGLFKEKAYCFFSSLKNFTLLLFNLDSLVRWCFTIFACQRDIMHVCRVMIFPESLSMHRSVLRAEESRDSQLMTLRSIIQQTLRTLRALLPTANWIKQICIVRGSISALLWFSFSLVTCKKKFEQNRNSFISSMFVQTGTKM